MAAENQFQIWPAKGGGYYWHLMATNNEIVCSSQVYTTFEAAEKGAFWVKDNATTAKVWDYTKD